MRINASEWRVLVIDDDHDNLELAADVLGFAGATVAVADSGQAGLEIVNQCHPTIILLDLAMPGLDGWSVYQTLRSRPELDSVPIIALTAHAMRGDAEKAFDAGFDGYITKPFRIQGLLEEIAACVQSFADRKGLGEPGHD